MSTHRATHANTQVYVCQHTGLRLSTHRSTHVCSHANTPACTQVQVCAHPCTHTHACACAHTHTHAHARIHDRCAYLGRRMHDQGCDCCSHTCTRAWHWRGPLRGITEFLWKVMRRHRSVCAWDNARTRAAETRHLGLGTSEASGLGRRGIRAPGQ